MLPSRHRHDNCVPCLGDIFSSVSSSDQAECFSFFCTGSHRGHMRPIGAANGILMLRDIVIQPLYPYRFGQLDSYLVFRMKGLLQ